MAVCILLVDCPMYIHRWKALSIDTHDLAMCQELLGPQRAARKVDIFQLEKRSKGWNLLLDAMSQLFGRNIKTTRNFKLFQKKI